MFFHTQIEFRHFYTPAMQTGFCLSKSGNQICFRVGDDGRIAIIVGGWEWGDEGVEYTWSDEDVMPDEHLNIVNHIANGRIIRTHDKPIELDAGVIYYVD